MTIDPVELADLATRKVRHGARGATPTRIVSARRVYGTDQADLWDALTNTERLPRWFLPVTGDLEPGGRYQLQGNAGGTIETCVEPESFSLTWEFGETTSWLTVSLTPIDGGKTTLELSHEAPIDPGFWDQYGPGATGIGWDLAVMALGDHVETGRTFGPGDEEAFSASPAGAEFLRAAAAGWREAAIVDGDDAESARAAAERSRSFYTPEPGDEPAN